MNGTPHELDGAKQQSVSPPDRVDVLVIGGGIHGVGVAQAAAAAGYSVMLLEQSSLAAGTSSRSSKLIHGGLRYLESFHVGLVRESLHEREILLQVAPDLVRRQPFLIPVYPQTSRRPLTLRAGLSLYAILSGFRRKTGFGTIPKSQWNQLDGLQTAGLQHVFQYWDAQTDDRRLTEAVWMSAESLGAILCCPATFQSAVVHNEFSEVQFQYADRDCSVSAGVVVNAAGPWAKDVAQRITPEPPTPRVENVQGTHLELPGTIKHGCYYVEAPQDGRAVFVMPWYDRTLLGTTEVVYDGDPGRVAPTPAEVDYLLEVYQHYFPHRSTEILDQWAGLRVLPASEGNMSRRSRETQQPVDNETTPRVISIFGGKLTGYRATAEKTIELISRSLPVRKRLADTRTLRLSLPPGAPPGGPSQSPATSDSRGDAADER